MALAQRRIQLSIRMQLAPNSVKTPFPLQMINVAVCLAETYRGYGRRSHELLDELVHGLLQVRPEPFVVGDIALARQEWSLLHSCPSQFL